MTDLSGIAGCSLLRLPDHADARGGLIVAEFGERLPFSPARLFVVHGVPSGARRGGHANRKLHELLIAVGGAVTVDVDDGRERGTLVLDDPALALHLPPLTWSVQRDFATGASLVVLASLPYDAEDSVADYAEFRRLAGGG